MKVHLIWWLPLLCACGSGARLANDPAQERDSGRARIQWTRPAPITVHEVDDTRTFHPEESLAGGSCRTTHPDPARSAAELGQPGKELAVTPDETLSANAGAVEPVLRPVPRPVFSAIDLSVPSTPVLTSRPVDGDTPRSERPMNKLAVYAFIGSVVGLAGSIFLGALWILVIVGFVLGIIALVQIGHRKERGRGFALAAILTLVAWIVVILLVMENGL